MNAREWLDRPLSEVAAGMRRRDLGAEELAAAAIERATALQPTLNAFIRLRTDAALAEARACDDDAASGRWRGPLHGIPLAHKDCFDRVGETMTVGSRVPALGPGRERAAALDRLAAAGAVDLGALNLSEMVAGPTGQNPHFGDCCNAWDPSRISGGSSSGSGACVAAGVVFGSLGTDAGGSIRLPASMNGLFGLKTTYGRVSRRGCFPRAFSLECIGPLARSAEDCALLLHAIAGHDPADPTSLDARVPDYTGLLAWSAEGSRIGVLAHDAAIDPGIAEVFERFVQAAEARYGIAPRTRFDALPACYAMADVFSKVEAAALHGPWMRDHAADYSQAVYSRTEPGLHVPAVRYLEALTVRAQLLAEFVRGPLSRADVLLLPTVPVPVPTRAEADMESGHRVFGVVASLTALTRPFNYLGLPVLSMPIGHDAAGMPVGVQLVGRPLAEARLLAMAHALSADIGWQPRTAAALHHTHLHRESLQ
ncbi:Glutamyl-tRNA(Gln) amidotransferase subunit A (plasmid) [Variovorax sp. SRS16]|uniref:amidase n=1 Tax=Variovorax sp. SRS16 TaxID=282217 RepID=UPI001316B3C9|nr:amidase [Variovorax sp. SRS16]VTU46427.1 Glutamyl-tRNA(Gln) amidotransferase subunit A [Variovorax sp. SRS16]